MPDMTLAEALALADQDCPLPKLAGQALKVLRAELLRWRPSDAWLAAQKEAGRLDLAEPPNNPLFLPSKDC